MKDRLKALGRRRNLHLSNSFKIFVKEICFEISDVGTFQSQSRYVTLFSLIIFCLRELVLDTR